MLAAWYWGPGVKVSQNEFMRLAGIKAGRVLRHREVKALLATIGTVALSGCGGGGGGGTTGGVVAPPVVVTPKPTAAEASRFLAQASFGATDSDISAATSVYFGDWISAQIALPPGTPHLTWMDRRLTELRLANATATLTAIQFYESFWNQAVTAPDQLRQRVKFALSEIFVVSFSGNGQDARGLASWYDMLGKNVFGNFRQLLEDVTYHPAMGLYLSYLANQKEDARSGRNPDQNYAREVMQLMTIGLYQLNADGSQKTDLLGAAQPTYTQVDIDGLAKVFTGLSWYNPSPTNLTFVGFSKDAEAYTRPMIPYGSYHSISAKNFLGTSIAAVATPDPTGDVKTALDTLFNHPNVGPFIGKQLIQRLVTSNPSPGYIGRVTAAFNNNGSGVRGDMGAVVRAILLDTEARSATANGYGKLREPIVRLAHWMRAFEATSASGDWLMGSTSANTSLAESPLTSPTVFNFYRPGYVPPNTLVGNKNLLAPEFQVTDEVSVASYANIMQTVVGGGAGSSGDIKSLYSKEVALADTVPALMDRISLLLFGGALSDRLRAKISNVVAGVAIPGGTSTQSSIDAARLNRVKLAVYLSLVSPEYISQQ